MLKKNYRLTTKDIHYMLRRAMRYKSELFVFLTIPQYSNKQYHQRAISVPVLFDKRAVVRNSIKRLFFDTISDYSLLLNQPFSRFGYQKIFVYFNKYANESSPISKRKDKSHLQPNKKTSDEIIYWKHRIQQEVSRFITRHYDHKTPI